MHFGSSIVLEHKPKRRKMWAWVRCPARWVWSPYAEYIGSYIEPTDSMVEATKHRLGLE